MAKADMERTTYSAFERFLYFFLIPMIYSSILVTILFLIFNQNVRESVMEAANKIPVIKEIVPDPNEGQATDGLEAPEVLQVQREAQAELQEMENELRSAIEASRLKDSEIEELMGQIEELQEQLTDKQLSLDEYTQQIRSLSNMYASMNPSKAAPIMENLLPSELVLILSQMSMDERVEVLERMNPRIAAEATMALKDLDSVEDAQISALQDRIAELEAQVSQQSDALSTQQLSETFAAMEAASAAALLLEMRGINETEVVAIMRAMNNQARSLVLTEMSKSDSAAAASLSSKLSN